MSSSKITLDNPIFNGRLRDFGRGTPFVHKPSRDNTASLIEDIMPRNTVRQINTAIRPAQPKQSPSVVLRRSVTEQPKKQSRGTLKISNQSIMFAMAVIVFVAGLCVAGLGLKTNNDITTHVRAASANTKNEEAPSEDKPSNALFASHTVDPSMPRYVRINKIKVSARVFSQGLDKKGALKAPGNVNDAGWYKESSKPGEAGAVLIDGHVSGPTQRGVFYQLHKLVAGDVIEIERGDGKVFTYKVVKSKTTDADKTDMSEALLSAELGKPGINLITCTGKYDTKKGAYDKRIVVSAIQQ